MSLYGEDMEFLESTSLGLTAGRRSSVEGRGAFYGSLTNGMLQPLTYGTKLEL